jgi:hypothetical protein
MASVLRRSSRPVLAASASVWRSTRLSRAGLRTSAAAAGAHRSTGLIYHEHGAPGAVLRSHSWQLPAVQKDEAVVRMVLSSVNPADINV